jgi:hypothetical protein
MTQPRDHHRTQAESQPESPLLQVVLSFLTPLMLAGGIADPDLARRAAQQAIAAHQTGPLLTIAQTVAFALAALDSLRLSAPPDLSPTMKLRLRGNANALNRSASRTAASLAAANLTTSPASSSPGAPATQQAPTGATAATDREDKLTWANAMTDVAAECARNLANLTPKQRHAETIRIAALHATARRLTGGASAQPHPPQQSIAQHEPMIQRAAHMQSGHPKQHPCDDLVHIPHRHPPR